MNLLTPQHVPEDSHEIKQRAREFAAERILPAAATADVNDTYPTDILSAGQTAGLAGRYFPEQYGGAGWSLADRLAVIEEFFRADGGIGLALQLADFGAKVVAMHGTEHQRSDWLPPVAEQNLITGLAATEPRGGSDLAGMETTARRDGDEYVLNGEKHWTSNGVIADWVVVYARTGDEPGHDAYSLLVVPTETAGYTAEPIDDKTGLRASQQARIELDNVRVPADNLLGEPNNGFYQIASFFNYGRIAVAGHGIGLAAAAIEAAWEYVHERQLYDKPVADNQTVQHTLVELREQFEAARALTWTACQHVSAGEDPAFWASLAKRRATTAAETIAKEAATLHGGKGLRETNRINKIRRDAMYPSIYEGANAVQGDIVYQHWPEDE